MSGATRGQEFVGPPEKVSPAPEAATTNGEEAIVAYFL
jgi:hypothetical protein